ncbi:hypothetical protein [Caballeronia sp. BR00000012568055]|uniref:hypothetical protein n=1 Tax=Caballeronia sp. BR00000012568055 TaxID=2918761 RepID=UPI0034D6F768
MAPVLHRSAKDHGHGRPRRKVQQQVRTLLHQEVSRALRFSEKGQLRLPFLLPFLLPFFVSAHCLYQFLTRHCHC